jgi:Uma2 family endonuclease
MATFSTVDLDLLFPDSDGKPMADNTEQFRWIVMIKENLEILFKDDPMVFIAGDLLWYPVQSTAVLGIAPDVMVVFGRPKGKRGSYKQWQEENLGPQVVFEILSPSNTTSEMEQKRQHYQVYGVQEYYLYDPNTNQMRGWQRQGAELVAIAPLNQWVSPRLGIRFEQAIPEWRLYHPDGRQFLTSVELDDRAEQERNRAEQERIRAAQAEAALQLEKEKSDRLAQLLREQGIDPDKLGFR